MPIRPSFVLCRVAVAWPRSSDSGQWLSVVSLPWVHVPSLSVAKWTQVVLTAVLCPSPLPGLSRTLRKEGLDTGAGRLSASLPSRLCHFTCLLYFPPVLTSGHFRHGAKLKFWTPATSVRETVASEGNCSRLCIFCTRLFKKKKKKKSGKKAGSVWGGGGGGGGLKSHFAFRRKRICGAFTQPGVPFAYKNKMSK